MINSQNLSKNWRLSSHRSNFRNGDFTNSLMKESEFTDAGLEEVSFINARIIEGDFRGAHLQEANFTGADLKGCNFFAAEFVNTIFTDAINIPKGIKDMIVDGKITRVCSVGENDD